MLRLLYSQSSESHPLTVFNREKPLTVLLTSGQKKSKVMP